MHLVDVKRKKEGLDESDHPEPSPIVLPTPTLQIISDLSIPKKDVDKCHSQISTNNFQNRKL
jgi:hypothetical protein